MRASFLVALVAMMLVGIASTGTGCVDGVTPDCSKGGCGPATNDSGAAVDASTADATTTDADASSSDADSASDAKADGTVDAKTD
ncbi:hypothetical protein BH09MYX1_BH09MYX1_42930 [soil metagenome]